MRTTIDFNNVFSSESDSSGEVTPTQPRYVRLYFFSVSFKSTLSFKSFVLQKSKKIFR